MTSTARRWFLVLAIAALACVTYTVIPSGSSASPTVYELVALAAAIVMLVTILRMPTRVRGVWWAVWGYVVLSTVGDLIYNVESYGFDELPFPGPADLVYLGAYVFAFIALALLIRRMQPGRDLEAWIDSAILALAAASVVGVLVVDPLLDASDSDRVATAVSIAYPLVDTFLLAGLARLIVGRGRVNRAMALLCIAFTVTLVADLFYSFVSANGFDQTAPPWLDVLYLVAFITMVAAANAPGATSMAARPKPASLAESPGTGRLIALGIGALTVPIVLVVSTWNDGTAELKLLALACVAVVILVLWRVRLLLGVVQKQSVRLTSLAQTDGLTDLPNRRSLDQQLDRETDSADQSRRPLTIAMLDLDHFKIYNDQHGHQAGDLALVSCARTWSAELGSAGVLARYGGEEFAILFPRLGLAAARPILDRIHEATPAGQTVSIGYAERRPGENGYETMSRADRALYLAKETGRNRVVADGSTVTGP
ncbi:MAG: GGDEF domain-containing protein [bacterium]|nr:GGDEF domain-containing protein [bacterium]